MKICLITNIYSSYEKIGGSNIYVEKLSKELADRRNSVVVITINSAKGEEIEEKDNLKIYRFYPFNVSTFYHIGKESIIKQGICTFLDIYNYYSYLKIRNILKKENPDVVHIHTPIDITLSAFGAVKSLKLPLVFTLHDYLLLC